MALTIEFPPDLERQLREQAGRSGQAPEVLACTAVEEKLAAMARREGAAVLIERWLAEPPNEEDERWPEFEAALEANRPGQRSLFGG